MSDFLTDFFNNLFGSFTSGGGGYQPATWEDRGLGLQPVFASDIADEMQPRVHEPEPPQGSIRSYLRDTVAPRIIKNEETRQRMTDKPASKPVDDRPVDLPPVSDGDPDFRRYGDNKRVPASIRYNNPGAQYPGQSARKFGTTGTKIIGGGHKIAVFPSAVHGAAAQFDLLDRRYTGRTLASAISEWSGGNSVATYLKVLERETGVKSTDRITKEMLRDPKIGVAIAKAMAVQEAGKAYPMSDEAWFKAHKLAFNK